MINKCFYPAYRGLDQPTEDESYRRADESVGSDADLVGGGIDILRRRDDRGFHGRLGGGSFR